MGCCSRSEIFARLYRRSRSNLVVSARMGCRRRLSCLSARLPTAAAASPSRPPPHTFSLPCAQDRGPFPSPPPRMKASDRCGECPACLHPAWKQRCVNPRVGGRDGASTSAPSAVRRPGAPPPLSDSAFSATLRGLVSTSGALRPGADVARFAELCRRQTAPAHRLVLVTVLRRSADTAAGGGASRTQLAAVAAAPGLLAAVGGWVDALAAAPPDRAEHLALLVGAVTALPVTAAALAESRIGASLRRLARAPAAGVAPTAVTPAARAAAAALVDRWRSLVASGGGLSTSEAGGEGVDDRCGAAGLNVRGSGPAMPSATVALVGSKRRLDDVDDDESDDGCVAYPPAPHRRARLARSVRASRRARGARPWCARKRHAAVVSGASSPRPVPSTRAFASPTPPPPPVSTAQQ